MDRYEEALERAKAGKPMDEVFPELKESEDERIRKAIGYAIGQSTHSDGTLINGVSSKEALAYLEKQKDRETLIRELTKYKAHHTQMDLQELIDMKKHEHLELKAGHWYICHRAFCCRADHLTVKEGERFQCEKDGIVKGFVIKEPEKYFKECSAPAPMEDEQKEQKPAEWSEKDEIIEKAICVLEANFEPYEEFSGLDITRCQLVERLKSLRPQPRGEIYQTVKHDLAIKFMNYLDENRPEGKMNLSNGECEDIDKAFQENDWAKILRYIEKYGK